MNGAATGKSHRRAAGSQEPVDAVWELSRDVEAPAHARALVRAALAGPERSDAGERVEVAELLVSELVTNVIRHSSSDVRLTVRRLPGGALRVEIGDSSPLPPVRIHRPGADGGFGLQIVSSLAERWGVERTADGKVVWFELDPIPTPTA